MGYTIEKGKIVIWTSKRFVPDEEWPNDDDGENYTCFYKNLYDSSPFAQCLARMSDEYKKNLVGERIDLSPDKIVIRSKKAHHSQNRKQKT